MRGRKIKRRMLIFKNPYSLNITSHKKVNEKRRHAIQISPSVLLCISSIINKRIVRSIHGHFSLHFQLTIAANAYRTDRRVLTSSLQLEL